MNTDDTTLSFLLIAATLGTYLCRAIGVKLAGYINTDSEIFKWLSCVTYAMVAALTLRLIVLPTGALATVPIWIRLLICGVSVGMMLLRPAKRSTFPLLVGVVLIFCYGIWVS